jgi:TPR repeat protein/uncharacterized membrane protein
MSYLRHFVLTAIFLCGVPTLDSADGTPLTDAGKAAVKAKDYSTALAKFEEACESGEADGCSGEGVLYSQGLGVEKKQSRAVALFVTACQKGSGVGCYNLGDSYYDGGGVPKDLVQAFTAFSKACDLGYLGGCNNVGFAYEYGEGTKQDKAKALAFYTKACNGNETNGCENAAKLARADAPAHSANAMAQTLVFTIDAVTLAAQVPPSKAGDLVPQCRDDVKVKVCASQLTIDKFVDPEERVPWLDQNRLKRLAEILKKNPGETDAQYQRANMYIADRQYGAALADLNQIVKIAPSSVRALVRRAELYMLAGQYDLAMRDLEFAHYWVDVRWRDEPSLFREDTLYMRADILLRQGKTAEAQAMYQRAIDLSKYDTTTRYETLHRRFASLQTGMSIAELAELKLFFEVAFIHEETCDKPPLLDRALKTVAYASPALGYLANLPEKCQSNEESLKFANRALQLPNHVLLDLVRRANIYERMGRMVEAITDINAAYMEFVKLDKDSTDAMLLKYRLHNMAKKLPPEKFAALGITLPPLEAAVALPANAGTIKICNRTAHKVRLVLGYLEPGETYPATRGWYDLAADGCNSYNAQAGTNFTYHAIDSVTYSVWKGGDQICVAKFLGDWTQRGYAQCSGNFEMRPATTVRVENRVLHTEELRQQQN